jgi:hypothetical protein
LPRLTIALGTAGLVAFAVVWMQLLAEFPKTDFQQELISQKVSWL